MEDLEHVFDAVASYFSVMSVPMRLKIMRAVCHEEKSVTQIVEEIGGTQTNISRHLNIMYRGGVLARRRLGNQVLYRAANPAMMEICRTVCLQIAGEIDDREPLRKDFLKFMPQRRKTA